MKTTLIDALKRAGNIQVQSFGNSMEYSVKESISSIVTEVDINSEKTIIEVVLSTFPNHNILSEECGYIDNHSNYTWVIDPIDGTSNFAAGIPWFGILIAVFDSGIPIMGGAYLPVSQNLYFAEKGNGAFLNGKLLKMENQELSKALFAFSTDYTTDGNYLNEGVKLYKYMVQHSRNIRCTNSLVDMLYVAEGKFGGCINMFTKIWDIAFPYLLITEAGGLFKDLNLNKIVFDLNPNGMYKNYGIVAGSESIIESVKGFLGS